MSSAADQQTLYLVDAHSLIFQVFHAVGAMSSPAGLPTNALFGFTRDMLMLRQEKKPDLLVCAFDEDGGTFRHEFYPEYKANRSAMPQELAMQLAPIRQMLAAMRIPVVSKPNYEADDIIATLAVAADRAGMNVVICTSDKDCRQLISDRVRLYNLRKDTFLDRAALQLDWGIAPEQVVDFQTLVGDSVDNVPGVPGIGEKTAAKLLQQYQTLDNLLANADKVTAAKQRSSLLASGERVQLSRRLVQLDRAVEVPIDWPAWRVQPWDSARLEELFREWGFHRFASQVRTEIRTEERTVAKASARKSRKKADTDGAGLFDDLEPSTNGACIASIRMAQWPEPHKYHLVDTAEAFAGFLAGLAKQQRFAFDTETTDLDPLRAQPVGFSFSWQPAEAWYLAVRGPAACATLDPEAVLRQLKPLLENPAVAKVGQNIKYDMLVMRQQGIGIANVAGDSMLADYLLNVGEREHGIDELANRYFKLKKIKTTDLIGPNGKNQKTFIDVPTAEVAEYSGEDADVALRLCNLLEPRLAEQGLEKLYRELEVPLIEVLAELEFNGIRIDVPRLQTLSTQMGAELAQIEQQIYDAAGETFQIGSLKQLRTILFDKLKLIPKRRTGITGVPSTDQETLEELASEGAVVPKLLLTQRKLSKLKSTYIDALPAQVNPDTGRVHASFNQTVAATGRLSSSDPNLQNIPIRSEQGGQIRQAFIPAQGWVLLTADYSQIELRLLAHFSEDVELRRAFAEDQDVHTLVASQIYGVAVKDVQPEMRRMAKTVNFGVIYGMSAFGLAQRLELSNDEASQFIDAYFARYPRVRDYQDNLLRRAHEQGYVYSLLGRRREFRKDVIRPDSTYKSRTQPEREAINMEIQSSAADLIKVAMLNIHRRLQREHRQARMLLQVHDELVFECPPSELHALGRLVRDEMVQALADRIQVPLKVEVSAGPNWLDAEELPL